MEVTLAFLLLALAAYTLFGGADFGGGILETTLWRRQGLQRRLQGVLAPVWEANHVWLIAVIVILFVGFPPLYSALCTMLFVPMSLTLVGIILRGAFFTFRRYDPDPAARLPFYSFLFRASSALTPMMFGMIMAALLRPFPTAKPGGTVHFAELYVEPWMTVFGLLCALFVFALFGYSASVFFYGELDNDSDRAVIARRIWGSFISTFLMGGAVLAYGALEGIVVLSDAWNPVQIAAQAAAILCLPWLWWSMKRNSIWGMRLAAGGQVLCILAGWFATQYPAFMLFEDGSEINFRDGAAPPVTLFWLNVGLAVVLSMVLPLLIYLYKVFGAARHVGLRTAPKVK